MRYVLGTRSKKNLEGVHPDMVAVVKEAIRITNQDFTVIWGVRTAEQQNELYQKGRTKPGNIVTYKDGYRKKSNHQAKSDGYGHAVDLVPYPIDWNDWTKFELINDAMQEAGRSLGVKVIWGGNWKFRDAAHFELG